MSLASLYQRPPEFDFLLYQDAWACLSEGGPVRDAAGRSCSPESGRQLREFFAQRSSARPLRDYLAENGASCRTSGNITTCGYTSALGAAPPGFGRVTPSGEEAVVLTVSFPASDVGLAPQQIRTALRRFTRQL